MTTEQRTERAERTGFRLPWNSDRRSSGADEPTDQETTADAPAVPADALAGQGVEAPAADAGDMTAPLPGDWARTDAEDGSSGWVLAGASAAPATADARSQVAWPAEDTAPATATATATDIEASAASGEDAIGAPALPADAGTKEIEMTIASPTPATGKSGGSAAKPSKFMADLSRAMQVAAQAAREESLAKVAAEAKQRIEEIQQQGSSGTTELRRRADDDVAATREWSKAEIARIREETDRRIAERKGRLEADVEVHAAQIRRRADLVRGAVTEHEAALAAFMEQLMAEEDPARIATLAQSMPDAPVFDDIDTAGVEWAASRDAAHPDPTSSDGDGGHDGTGVPTAEAVERAEGAALRAEDAAERADEAARAALEALGDRLEGDPADGADGGDVDRLTGADEATPGDATAAREADAMSTLSDESAAAAEAEAFGGLEGGLDGGLAASWMERQRVDEADVEAEGKPLPRSTLLVAGLSTVAGIAGFKRELSRVPGVRSVGVSAGDAGQFVFAVSHQPDVDLAAAIPAMTTFQATVTDQSPDGMVVTAVEPSAEE